MKRLKEEIMHRGESQDRQQASPMKKLKMMQQEYVIELAENWLHDGEDEAK